LKWFDGEDFGAFPWNIKIWTIYLLGFFSKYECWVIDLIMPLYHFISLGCHAWFFVSRSFISLWNVKNFHMTNFSNEICLINIQIISFNSFKYYENEIFKILIWKILQELIKIKHVNLEIKYDFNMIFLRYNF